MYTKFLCDKFNELGVKENNVALLVTHHNRMRSTDLNQGLLPFRSKKIDTQDGEEKSAYANNFCLKIQINPGQEPTFEVFFPGFPDKGSFKGDCINTTPDTTPDTTPTSSFPKGTQKVGLYFSGGGSYYYECNTNNINTDVVSDGIKNGLINFTKPMTIYVIRHGNALHNKPVNVSDSFTTDQKRLDSSLTPLGMYQATILAKKFIHDNAFANSNVILCCSFLQRTQLTGLLLLEAALKANLQPSMNQGLKIMKGQALIRFKNTGLNINEFRGYPPVNTDFASFDTYYKQLSPSGGGKTRKRKGKKVGKTNKSKKIKRRTRRRKN